MKIRLVTTGKIIDDYNVFWISKIEGFRCRDFSYYLSLELMKIDAHHAPVQVEEEGEEWLITYKVKDGSPYLEDLLQCIENATDKLQNVRKEVYYGK